MLSSFSPSTDFNNLVPKENMVENMCHFLHVVHVGYSITPLIQSIWDQRVGTLKLFGFNQNVAKMDQKLYRN